MPWAALKGSLGGLNNNDLLGKTYKIKLKSVICVICFVLCEVECMQVELWCVLCTFCIVFCAVCSVQFVV